MRDGGAPINSYSFVGSIGEGRRQKGGVREVLLRAKRSKQGPKDSNNGNETFAFFVGLGCS
jgi:hypothetical protein